MLKRIIMLRLKDIADERPKKDNALMLKGMLEQLKTKIEEIEHFKVAINIADDPAAADIALIAFFADRQAFERFHQHPEHNKISKFIKSVSSERWFVEYEE